MRHLTLLRYSGSLFWLTFFVSFAHAQTAPLPAAAGVAPAVLRWGAQGGSSEVSVEANDTGVKLRVGKLQVPLALPAVRTLQIEMVQLKGGVSVGIVRVSGEQESAATLIVRRANGTLEALWSGLTQLAGDRGERQAQAIEVGDRDGDGAADVVVGTYDERVQICGQARTLLSPRALDPKSLTLKSVLLNRAADRTTREQLTATTTAPVAQTPAVLHGLHAIGASSAVPEPGRSPAAVSDSDLSTSWVEGRGLGGRFEFVTLRWAAPGRTIRALAVVPVPSAPTGTPTAPAEPSSEAHARVLSLLGDKGDRLVATLPEDPRPGQRYWIVPSAPLDWSCLTVSIDDVFPGSIGPKTHTGIAEIEAYTELDFAGGLDKLVAELAQDGPNGDDATQQLASARGDVVAAVIATWPRLSALGKRRALRVLFAPQHPDLRSTQLLRTAMRDADNEVNQRAIELARSRVEGGPALLLELAHDPTPQGDRAALALAHSTDPNAFSGLLTVLLGERGSERPVLRDALLLAYRATGAEAPHALARWLGDEPGAASPTPPPIAARAALALALSAAPESQAAALSLFQRTRDDSREFADQWRLVQAASTLTSEANGDAWLAGIAHDAEPWMLRMAALAALDARHAATASDVARRALSDDYPRVRANALKVLSGHSPDVELLSGYARDDKWFLVRVAALEALPDSPKAQPTMLAAVGDRTPIVRATAVRVLQRARVPGAWDRIKPLLDNREEYPEVIAEGVAFAKALCVVAATPDLEAVAERGLKPDAWTPDQELAVSALETLSAFGGSAAAWARDHAVGPLVPKQLHDAAAAAAEKPGTCGTSPVL